MGFLDKVKAQAEQAVKQGQEKLEDVQAKKKADGLLRDLGAWYYARETERDDGKADGEIARIVAALHAHEQEHGPLGAAEEEPPPPPPAPPAPPVDGAVPPPPPPPPMSPPPSMSPPPVSSPPPPMAPPPPVAPPSGAPPAAPPGAPPATPPGSF